MEWGSTTLAFYGLGAAAVATSLVTLRRRLELSKAKHGTLSGHANLARRLALLVPFYDYDEHRFFCSDDAPDAVGKQEVEILLLQQAQNLRAQRHLAVTSLG